MKIHQVKTRLVNTYVIEYSDKIFVMDVAVGCHRYVLGFIEHELKRDIHDVVLVTCSHDDPDHMGGVRRLAALCDAQIAIPSHAGVFRAKLFADPAGFLIRTITALREGLRGRMWHMYFNPRRGRLARQKPKYTGKHGLKRIPMGSKKRQRMSSGECLPGFSDWLVIHTPGHSWDSVCFYHKNSGSLLTGDTLLGSAKLNKVVIPSIYANATQMEASLDKLRKLSLNTIYPGHGSVISTDLMF